MTPTADVEFIFNGAGYGDTAAQVAGGLGGVLGPGVYRPVRDERGRVWVTVNTGRPEWDHKSGRPVRDPKTGRVKPEKKTVLLNKLRDAGYSVPTNNASALTKFQWVQLEQRIIQAVRQRLRAWADLSAVNTVSGIPYGKTTYEYQSMNDVGEAVVDMDNLSDDRNDRALVQLMSVPMPVIHSGFHMSDRFLQQTRLNGGQGFDLRQAEMAGRRVAERLEMMTIGLDPGVEFGTNASLHTGLSKIYGWTNVPYRITKTNLTPPTGSNPAAVAQDVLQMRETLRSNGYFGPYMLYVSSGYDLYLDDDYFRAGGTSATRLLRERILAIEDLQGIRRLDYMPGIRMILVQLTPDTAAALESMAPTTMTWDTAGGARKNFRVMTVRAPLIYRPYNGVAPVVDATTS